MRIFRASAVTLFLGCTLASAAWAQGYPSKPIRFISPYSPGGGTDITARLIAQKLAERTGQSVLVDNRPGAGGVIGTDAVAKSAPDGYTIMLASPSPIAVAPHLHKKLPYDPIKDLAPVTLISIVPALVVVHPSLPARSIKELLALAKSRPGELTFSSSGTGGTGHLSGELLKMMGGVEMLHVPYKGTGPATTGAISGEVSMSIGNMMSVLPHVRSNKLRALAITTPKRSPIVPELPTVAETLPGYSSGPWYGVLAPGGTPQDIVAKLNHEIVQIVRSPDMQEKMKREGAEPVGSTPAEFAAHIKADTARWGKVIRQAKITAN